MEKKIIECVPNFSEGRNMNIIKAITDEIEKVDGAVLLDVDPGKATNRTVAKRAKESYCYVRTGNWSRSHKITMNI